jgi:hypothetical protein
MPTFRCYFLDGDGHIKSRTEIEVDGLPQAIEQALKLLKEQPEGRAVEVWQGAQRLYPEGRSG